MNAYERLADARNTLRSAEKKFTAAVIRNFPVGAFCSYEHGRHRVKVVVLDHGGCPGSHTRIKVQSVRSGKQYWLDATRFLP